MPRKSKYEASTTKTPTAQKEAIKAYRKRNGGAGKFQKTIGATYSRQEGDRIAADFAAANLTPAQILRAVALWIEQGTHAAAVAGIAEDAADFAAANAAIRAERAERAAERAEGPSPEEAPQILPQSSAEEPKTGNE